MTVFAGVAMAVTLLRMRLHNESLVAFLWPVNRNIGVRRTATPLRLSRYQSCGIAVAAFCDLWFRCAPFSVPEVSGCAQ